VVTQHDSAAAAANFVNLLFIGYLPRHRGPVAGLGPLQSDVLAFRCIAPRWRRKGRIQRSDTWAGEGSRSVSQSGGQREAASHCRSRLPKSVSIPIADVFRNGTPAPNAIRNVDEVAAIAVIVAPVRIFVGGCCENAAAGFGPLIRRSGYQATAVYMGGLKDNSSL
jgi:hypothetical protein